MRTLARDLFLDVEHECLIWRGKPLEPGRRAVALIEFLCEHWPARYTAAHLVEAVWTDAHVGENSVHQLARRMHRQFAAWGILDQIDIEGAHAGYRLVLPKRINTRERIERVTITETHLVATAVSGSEAWTFRFPSPLQSISPEEREWRVQRIDLCGDGDIGVLVAAHFRQSGPSDTLFYVSSEGKLRWSLEAAPPLIDRYGRLFAKAWSFKHVVLVPASPDSYDVWAALANDAGWAGCILRVTAHGKAQVQFANTGFVEKLGYVRSADGDYVIACGETNAFENAFVALLGIDDPPSRSVLADSQSEGFTRYRYANAPSGTPRKYIRFPNTELIAARGRPYGHTRSLRQYPERVIVEVETGEDSCLLYHFSDVLIPQFVFPSGSHEFSHRALEDAGKIRHPWKHCPERARPLTLKVWEPGTGWRDQSIPWRDDPWTEK